MKSKNGITLIALVITIIVLLILAGVSMSAILGKNGIIAKSKEAQIQTDIGGDKEEIALIVSEYNLEGRTEQGLDEYLKNRTDKFSDVIKFNGIITLKMNDCSHIYSIDLNGNINLEENDGRELADDSVDSRLKTMITTWEVESGQTLTLPVLISDQDYNDGDIVTNEYDYEFVVDWGDGKTEHYSSKENVDEISMLDNYINIEPEITPILWAPDYKYVSTHTYETAGIYQIKITGSFGAWYDEIYENPTLLSINQWGVTNTQKYGIYMVTQSIASPSKNSFKNNTFSIGINNEIKIPMNLFSGVKDLYINQLLVQDIMISKSVQNVSIYAEKMYNIYVEEGNLVYTSDDGVLYSKDKKQLIKFPQARTGEFIIPSFVESVESNSFENSNIEIVKISEGVKTIKKRAFGFDNNIVELYICDSVDNVEVASVYACTGATIYCEADEKPAGWNTGWLVKHGSNQVIWGYSEN